MTLTQILQKIRSCFYTKTEIDTKETNLNTAISSKANTSALSGYLPLSGGQMTGDSISRNVNNELAMF